nr:DEAD/DEAH box helicase family protein [Pseudomonas sp. UBA6718]
MELNAYQDQVLADLRLYLQRWRACDDAVLAYRAHWDAQGALNMPGYRHARHGAPQVCAKVPTAGGKTFIGLHATACIFEQLQRRQGDARLCVWLVPSLSILQQVLGALRNPQHPYRQTLNRLFDGRVTVLDKSELLAGGQFSLDEVRDGLVLTVLSYDSLRASNKENRKLYQENSALDDFAEQALALAEGTDPASLVAAMAGLNPVIIVDESHNVTSGLSQEMLCNLNPAFVLELTATPREGANIISFVDAMALRDQHMVKLPVIVRNLADQDAVLSHAIDLRARLEAEAQAELAQGGCRIRPIVLVQAESKSKEDARTFERAKADLLERGIPADWVKIKTANLDELKGIDLAAADCPVRFIITVNALKEGWDCPFAYVLATLADRSAAVDVEQILGRILRQPYVRQHGQEPLNMSYVLTASSVFSATLEKIVAGLNRAGFSRRDFRTPDAPVETQAAPEHPPATSSTQPALALSNPPPATPPAPATPSSTNATSNAIEATLSFARQANSELELASQALNGQYQSQEVRASMDIYPVRPAFADDLSSLRLPQFFQVAPPNLLFGGEAGRVLLERDALLAGFQIADCNVNDFALAPASGDLVKLDLLRVGESSGDYEPTRVRLKEQEVRKWRDYLSNLDADGKRRQLSGLVNNWLGKMPPLADSDLLAYINKLLLRLSPAELDQVVEQQHAYVESIRQRIRQEMQQFARKRFRDWLGLGKLELHASFALPTEISPRQKAAYAAENSLYLREERGNGLEERMADFLIDCNNVRWWHRNQSNKGFALNGPIKHYPDFIVRLQSGMTVLLETKGGDRDNSDSAAKIELGQQWEAHAGRTFRYRMVFESNPPAGALSWAEACELLRGL